MNEHGIVTRGGHRLLTWAEWVEFDEANAVEFAARLRAIDRLHRRTAEGLCGECGKAWPCPTSGCAGADWKAPSDA